MELEHILSNMQTELANATPEQKREAANAILPFAAEASVQSKQIAKSGNARLGRIDHGWEADQLANHAHVIVVASLADALEQAASDAPALLLQSDTPPTLDALTITLHALGEHPHSTWLYSHIEA